jgi:hypothetical protein
VEEGDEFIILASDGLWDVMSSEEAVEVRVMSSSLALWETRRLLLLLLLLWWHACLWCQSAHVCACTCIHTRESDPILSHSTQFHALPLPPRIICARSLSTTSCQRTWGP